MTEERELPQIVLFGDSLTQWSFNEQTRGFGWVLEDKYAGKAEIVNEGQAGYTSSMLKRDFERIIERATRPYAPPTLLVTIFLGANDACLIGRGKSQTEYVPLPQFEDSIREFIETILIEDNMEDTKVVLISTPPISIPDPRPEDVDIDIPSVSGALEKEDPKESRSYRTYMSKKRYAEKIMEIAKSYEETDRVIALDLWLALIDAGLDDQNRLGDEDAYDEDRLPGCGLKWAKQFKPGYFTDGLHFCPKANDVLSKQLLGVTLAKWPELAPERIEE